MHLVCIKWNVHHDCTLSCCDHRLNDQMKPITDVLRETENLNLAPEVLEPEAQSIEKVQSSGIARNFGIRI